MVQDDQNGITGGEWVSGYSDTRLHFPIHEPIPEFNSRKFQPRKEVIASLKESTKEKAVQESLMGLRAR